MRLPALLARHPILVAAALVVVLVAVGEALSPGFAAPDQLRRLLVVAALLGIVAAGQNLVILGGREGIDLSVGGVVSLSAVVAGNVMQGNDAAIVPALVTAMGVGALFGLLNGLGVTLLRIAPLVMTLGMLGVLQGLLVVIRQGIPSGRAAPLLERFVKEPVLFALPGIVWLWIALAVLLAFVLHRTVYGQRVYAIGSNEHAARLAGVPTTRTRVSLFVLSGTFAALAGVLLLGQAGSSFANVGEGYMLLSIIAVVFGGTPLSGGRGGYTGTVAGAILLTVLTSILTTVNIDESGRQIVFGLTLLALMLFYGRGKALRS